MKFLILFLTLLSLTLFSTPDNNKISIITLDDKIINPVSAEYIEDAIDRAEREGDRALVIELDTPGGLLSSTRQIVKRMLNAEVPIVVFIAPSGSRAGSAGVFITLASHVAAMAPSTNIGAAHPVEFGESPKKNEDGESLKELIKVLKKEKGEGDKKEVKKKEEVPASSPMADKILNDTVAWVSTIAKLRGRNVEWAVRAVKESISDGETAALKQGVVDFIAKDLEELLTKIDGRKVKLNSGRVVSIDTKSASIDRIGMSGRQRFLDVLINPNIAYILMMLGFYGLLFEITHPGSWFPGVAGLISIILAFYAFHTLPTNYAGLALILLGMVLFIAEVFVTSFGLLSLGGVVSLVLGSLFLMDSAAEFMQVSLKVILPITAATGLIFFFLASIALKAQRQRSVVGVEALVGQMGEVVHESKIQIGGEIWEVVSEAPLSTGDRVQVISKEGMKLKVKKEAS